MKRFIFGLGLIALVILGMLLKQTRHPLIGQVVVLTLLCGNMGMLLWICRKHR